MEEYKLYTPEGSGNWIIPNVKQIIEKLDINVQIIPDPTDPLMISATHLIFESIEDRINFQELLTKFRDIIRQE